MPNPAASDAIFPRLHEVFGFSSPAERAGVIGVVMPGVTLDRRDALVERAEDGAPGEVAMMTVSRPSDKAHFINAEAVPIDGGR